MKHIYLPLIVFLATIAAAAGIRSEVAYSSARSAAQLYSKECASCHGKDGKSKTLKGRIKHSRNLADPEWQNSVNDERIFNSIMNGKRKMPSYGKKFSEQEIDALVAYVRALKR